MKVSIRSPLLLLVLLVACGEPSTSVDAGSALDDAAVADGGAGAADASAIDAGSTDAGVDAGEVPAGEHRGLFVGNSYTFVNDLPGLYEATVASLAGAPDPLVIESSTAGGRRLVQHAEDARTEGHPLYGWLTTGEATWTHVVLQEQSQIPGFGAGQADFEASRVAAAELARLATDRGARVIFYVTWGRRDGDDTNPGLFADFTAMQDRLDAGYAILAEDARAAGADVELAPIGGAFRVVHDAEADPLDPSSRFYELYAADGSHPSLAGSYLAACVLVATIFGLDARTIAYAPDGLDPTEAAALRDDAQTAIDAR